MMTFPFLEFVAAKLMGPAVSGSSSWRCPFCDSPRASFHVRPPKGDLPIKYTCFRCGAWGDEYDLVRYFHPTEDYGKRRERVERLRLDYEREHGAKAPVTLRGGENHPKGIPVLFSPETAGVLEAAMDDGWRLDELLFDLTMKLLERGEEIKARGTPANGRTEATGVTS